MAKAFSTDLANEVTSLGVQVHGGMGFVEETGAAQLMRDARILGIYEGTNGIQAIDLTARKLPLNGGATVRSQIAWMRRAAEGLRQGGRSGLRPHGGAAAGRDRQPRPGDEPPARRAGLQPPGGGARGRDARICACSASSSAAPASPGARSPRAPP